MAVTSEPARRKDAQRNREAILDAARELFAECAEVPMYEVARRAGVGQATLYRNFPDRGNLAAAILTEWLERTEQLAAGHAGDPDAFFVLLRQVVEMTWRCRGIKELAQEDASVGSAIERFRQRLAELMTRPMRDAKSAGTLRRDLTTDDIFMILQMARGAADGTEGSAARASAAGRALTLVLEGISPPARRT
jgi:AcrR family transcriptional regulator